MTLSPERRAAFEKITEGIEDLWKTTEEQDFDYANVGDYYIVAKRHELVDGAPKTSTYIMVRDDDVNLTDLLGMANEGYISVKVQVDDRWRNES